MTGSIYKLALDSFIIQDKVDNTDLTPVSLHELILTENNGYKLIDDPRDYIYIINTDPCSDIKSNQKNLFNTPITLTPKRNKQTVNGIKIISMSPLKKPKRIFSISPARKSFDWTRRSIKFNKLKINPKFIKKTVKPKKSLKLGLKRLVEQEYNLKEKIFSNHKEQQPLELKRKTSLKTRPTLKSPSKIRKLNRVY